MKKRFLWHHVLPRLDMTLNSRKLASLNLTLTLVLILAILFSLWEGFQARRTRTELEAERRQYVESLQTFAENQQLLEAKLIALETQIQRLREESDEN